MLNAGIPELSQSDLEYLNESFQVGKSEDEAKKWFMDQIDASIKLGWSTQLNWWIHNIAHKK